MPVFLPVLAGLGALAMFGNPPRRKKRKVRYVFDPISRKRVRVKSATVLMGGTVKRHRKSRNEVAGVRGPDGVWYRPNPKALDKRWAPASGWAILKRGERTSGVLYSSREQAEQQLGFVRRSIHGGSYANARIVKVNPCGRTRRNAPMSRGQARAMKAVLRSHRYRCNPSADDVRELVLFIVNDGDLYRQRTQPILANLAKKVRKGTYDAKKAVKLWGYLADAGAQSYTKQFGSPGGSSYGNFDKKTRMAAAAELQSEYQEALDDAVQSNPRRRRTKRSRR